MGPVQPGTVCQFLESKMSLCTEFTNPVTQSFQIALL